MICDFHMHSSNSFDSKEKMIDMFEAARKKGVKKIAITEHFSLNPKKKSSGHIDFKKYFNEVAEAKEQLKDIEIFCGLEICEPHLDVENLKKATDNLDLDFILGSVHNIGDSGLRTLANTYDGHKCYELYFDEVYKLAKYGDFDVLAHIDLMSRYSHVENQNYDFNLYRDKISKILKTVIKRGKGIEINTSGLRNSLKSVHPKIDIIKLYKELGGEIVTTGSDAHNKEDAGESLDEAVKILKTLGFKYVYTYKNRNPIRNEIV